MSPATSFRPFASLLAGFALGLGPGLVAADWQGLLGNSPFGQSAAPAANAASGELEFRGVVEEGGVPFINLYDPATKASQWIPVHGQVSGLEVQAYNATTEKVQVMQAGRTLSLPLKQTRVTLVQAAPPPAAGAKPEENNGNSEERDQRRAEMRERLRERQENGNGPPGMRNLPPEAQAMIEEFRRRRASRTTGQPMNASAQSPESGRRP